jgi:hypothetical protein
MQSSGPEVHKASTIGRAVFSPCERYRYVLTRDLNHDKDFCNYNNRIINVCMLNPSTATHEVDDPTIRRCIGFARTLGFGHLIITNIFALRSTDPKALYKTAEPIGEKNDMYLEESARSADQVICAWGTHGRHEDRGAKVMEMLSKIKPIYALRLTKDGIPGHPLYLPGKCKPIRIGE